MPYWRSWHLGIRLNEGPCGYKFLGQCITLPVPLQTLGGSVTVFRLLIRKASFQQAAENDG